MVLLVVLGKTWLAVVARIVVAMGSLYLGFSSIGLHAIVVTMGSKRISIVECNLGIDMVVIATSPILESN